MPIRHEIAAVAVALLGSRRRMVLGILVLLVGIYSSGADTGRCPGTRGCTFDPPASGKIHGNWQ